MEGRKEEGADSPSRTARECDYGERCYRKNPNHFREFDHRHLNDLLERLEREGLQKVPEDYKPKISRQTINEQLDILRSFKPCSKNSSSDLKAKTENSSSKQNTSIESNDTSNSCSSSSSVYSRKRQSSPAGESSLDASSIKLKKETFNKEESNTEKTNYSGKKNLAECNKTSTFVSNMSSALSSDDHRRRMQSARSMSEAMSYFQEVKKRSQGNIREKHEAAAPYYFFLTSVTDSKQTHTEKTSLQLFDILDQSLGDLESSLQINFMVEFGWLMAQYHVANQSGKPITLLYGEMDVANLSVKHVTAVSVKPPSPFGSHHTKMCVLAYRDGSVRVCVHTANLVESDWDNRVQGVWLSPRCPPLPLGSDSAAGEAETGFKQDLMKYLAAYRLPELQSWLAKLRTIDFSQINVFFVASTPGSHKGLDRETWGHTKLASLLMRHAQIPPSSSCPPSTWQIIAQCSSIGSLGPQPTSWFCGEIKRTMSSGLGQALQNPPPIRLVYPTFQNVAESYDGLLGGGCLPYSAKTHAKQPWLQQYLFQWKCESRDRTRAMPHIKTYTRLSPDLSQIAWFHLTSANLSKAAWGSETKAGGISILSYEAGVLFVPKFVVKSSTFPIKKEAATKNAPVFPMPYDLPLTPYSSKDVPWFIDNLS